MIGKQGGEGGSGTVTRVSVVDANGFNGSVANPTTTPAITLSTSVSATQILYSDGTAIKGDAQLYYLTGQGIGVADNSTNQNIFIGTVNGAFQGVAGNNTATGNLNIGLGAKALYQITSGQTNTALGSNIGGTILTASNNTLLGNQSDIIDDTVNNSISLGNNSKAFKSNQLFIGGVVGSSMEVKDMFIGLNAYANDTAAGLSGLTTGEWYQTDGTDVTFLGGAAGVVVIKQ